MLQGRPQSNRLEPFARFHLSNSHKLLSTSLCLDESKIYNEPEMTPPTCLSPDPHEDNIKDPILHFLGCVEISSRNEFLKNPSNVQPHEEIAAETTADQPKGNQQHRDINKQRDAAWREDCLSELRRIAFLRSKLQEDEEEKHLVQKIEESRKAWKKSDVYKEGMQDIRKWRNSPKSLNEEDSEPKVSISKDNYDPARDVNTPFMLFKKQKNVSSTYEPDNETKDPTNAIWGKFPNQKTNVQRLLFDKEKNKDGRDDNERKNLLGGIDDDEKIRYFHIPSNNMLVSLYAPNF